jgi:hypothetical protein
MLVSCYPGFDATVDELDLAVTKYDEDQDFTILNTFYLYDTIIYITDDEDETLSSNIDHSQGPHIIEQVRQNLLSYGWEEIEDTTGVDVDVSILISALEVDVYYYYYYWWDYWYWYWYGWYPGYPGYPGYPIYPGYPTYPSYGYTVGSILIDMVDMDDVAAPVPPIEGGDPENPKFEIPIVWTGAVNGILEGSNENIQMRLTRQIGQVFEQSPYLHK